MNTFTSVYLAESRDILSDLDEDVIEQMAFALFKLRSRQGRLFFLGVGGSAATASHAVNDFRKIANINAYCITDNVAELTARTNDNGWSTTFSDWLRVSALSDHDALFILSVGGGSKEASPNIVEAIKYARKPMGIEQGIGATILGIVGRDGGYTKRFGDAVLVLPTSNYLERVTPHTEGITSIILHLLVSHPALAQ
jgi:D-sedoheptulose 7-phosphate isomerase